MEIHENVSHNTIFSLYFSIFSYDFIVYAYFPYAELQAQKLMMSHMKFICNKCRT